jgi:hypothetical protein
MKKIVVLFLTACLIAFTVTAAEPKTKTSAERDESKWTDLSYENIPILKILEAKEAFVIIYQKNKIGTGTTVIPKEWARGNPENPRKLKFRNTKNPNTSFMTIVKKGGEFRRVILTIPMSKRNAMWGVLDNSIKLEGLDKQNLDDVVL